MKKARGQITLVNVDDGIQGVPGAAGLSIIFVPGTIIISQQLDGTVDYSGAVAELKVLSGSIDVTGSASLRVASGTSNCDAEVPSGRKSVHVTRMHTSGDSMCREGQVAVYVTYGGTDHAMLIPVRVNLLGSFRTAIEADVETSIAAKVAYGYDNPSGELSVLQNVGKFIRSSEENSSRITSLEEKTKTDLLCARWEEWWEPTGTAGRIVYDLEHEGVCNGETSFIGSPVLPVSKGKTYCFSFFASRNPQGKVTFFQHSNAATVKSRLNSGSGVTVATMTADTSSMTLNVGGEPLTLTRSYFTFTASADCYFGMRYLDTDSRALYRPRLVEGVTPSEVMVSESLLRQRADQIFSTVSSFQNTQDVRYASILSQLSDRITLAVLRNEVARAGIVLSADSEHGFIDMLADYFRLHDANNDTVLGIDTVTRELVMKGTIKATNFFHSVCFFKEGGIHSSGWYYIFQETDETITAGLSVGDYVQLGSTISGACPTTYSADLVLCWPSTQNWEKPASERKVYLPHPADFEGKMVMVSGFNYGMNSGQFFVCCAAEPSGVSGFFSHGARHGNNGVEFSNRGSSCTLTTGGIAYFISVKEGGNFANDRDAYGWVLVENSTGGDIIIDGGGSVPTSVVRSVVGKTGDVAVSDIASALTGAGYKLTDTVYSHPTDGANMTIAAASKKVLSAITVDSQGHVTSVSSKTLAAADIPSLNASKITAGTLGVDRIPSLTVSKISDFPSSLPASDVYAWAKEASKPSYTLDEVSDGSTRKLPSLMTADELSAGTSGTGRTVSAALLSGAFAASGHAHSVFSDSAAGFAPAASDANETTAETAVGNYYLCADGMYRQLPANAFKNTTYSNASLGSGLAVQNNASASAAVTCTLGSYALTTGGHVGVRFLFDVPANATLNIRSRGAKAIYFKNAAITAGIIKAGDTALFVYDGTNYHLLGIDRWDSDIKDKQDALAVHDTVSGNDYALNSFTTLYLPVKSASSGNIELAFLTSVPKATASTLGGVKVGDCLSIDGEGVLSATVGEAYLDWGGRNIANGFSPTDAGMVSELGANHAAFLPAVCSTFEYSRDAGTTWTAYPGATDAMKIGFFSGIKNDFTCGYCMSSDGTGPVVGYQLRVTVDTYAAYPVYLDTQLRKYIFYVAIGRCTDPWCTIQIRRARDHDTDTWLTIADKVTLGGDGYNVINTNPYRLYNSSQYRDIRFIFGYDGVNSAATSAYTGLRVRNLFFCGGMGYANPSNMAKNGHLYAYDASQNATFPARITATEIVKSGGTGSQLLMANGSVCTLGTGLSMTNGVISVTGSVLQAATASTLGGVMIGAGLSVNNNGLLTADKQLQIYNSGNLLNTVTGLDLPLVSAGASGDPYRMKIDLSGYVSKVMLGTVEYTPSNGVVTLPAYPSGGGGGSSVFAISRNGQSVTLMGSNTSTFYFEEGDGIAMSKIANSSMSGLKVGLGLTQYENLEDLEYTLYASDARSLADYNALRRIDKTVLSGTITEGQFYSKNDGSVISNTKMKTALYTNVSVSKTYTARGFGLPSSGYMNVAMVHYFHNSTWLGYEESLPTQGPFEQVEELALTLPSNCNRIAICTQISYSPVLVETSLGARINSQDLKDAIAANKAALAELVGSGEGKLMKVTKAGTTIYVRTALNSDEDIITSYIQTDNGNYTWGNTYLGSKNLSDSGIMSNMIHQMGDSTAPLFITDPAPWHLWMQHGYCVPTITATNSLTAADIGSTWKDQNNREYKIGSVSGNLITLLPMVRAYTLEGTVTLQNFYRTNSGALPSLVTNANMKMYEYGVTSELTYKVSGARLPSSGYTNIALVVFLNGTTVLGYDESLPNHGDYTVTDHEIIIPTGCNKVIVSTHKDYNVTFAITDVYTRDWKSPTTTNSPSITKLTHVSGATHTSQITASSWSNTQLKPMMTLAARKMTADGREVTEDGVYYCDDFVISEQLNCTDPWTVQTFFPSVVQRNIGAVINETFAIHGMTCRYDTVLDMRKPYIFIAYGASQVQHFVPVEPLEGYDVYGMMPRSKRYYAPYSVNSTSRSGELAIRSETAASGLLVANKQVDRYITFFKNEDTSDMKIGCASGLSLTKGITIDSRRNDVFRVYQTGDDNILSISPANRNKAYFKVLSGTNFTHGVLPGSFIANFSTYMSHFDPMANEGQVYWYKDSGGYVVYAHYQEAYRKVAINLPKEMESLVVSVVDKTDGMTLLTDAVSGGKVYVSADGAESNYIVLKVSFTEEQFQGQYNPV